MLGHVGEHDTDDDETRPSRTTLVSVIAEVKP